MQQLQARQAAAVAAERQPVTARAEHDAALKQSVDAFEKQKAAFAERQVKAEEAERKLKEKLEDIRRREQECDRREGRRTVLVGGASNGLVREWTAHDSAFEPPEQVEVHYPAPAIGNATVTRSPSIERRQQPRRQAEL